MKFELYGKNFEFADLEYGLYKSNGIMEDYAVMDMRIFVGNVGRLPKERSIESLKQLKIVVENQLSEGPSRNIGYPILRGPEPTPLNEVRSYLQNTVNLCNYLLKELE